MLEVTKCVFVGQIVEVMKMMGKLKS